MAKLYQNSLDGFLYEGVKPGEIHFLVEGVLNELASWDNITKQWDWTDYSGSWHHNEVDDEGHWIDPEDLQKNTGTLRGGTVLTGLIISMITAQDRERVSYLLKHCDRLKMDVQVGTRVQSLDLKVLSRQIQNNYIYLEVDKVLIPSGLEEEMDIYFKYKDNNYQGYTCYPENDQTIIIGIYPFFPPVESEEYNPVLNNIIEGVEGTIARMVEPFELKNILLGSIEDAQAIYDGWYSPWTSSVEEHQYLQRLEGSSSYGTRPDGGGKVVNAGGALGIYQILPTVYLEKATTLAYIPDSFYTSIANSSGRWLGTKNAEYHTYLGDKLQFTHENILECKKDIQQNSDREYYLVSQDSPFVLQPEGTGSIDVSIKGTVAGTFLESSSLSGELQGTLQGTVSGYVTNINLDNARVAYCSCSNHILDMTIYTGTSSVTTQGSGTVLFNSWERLNNGNVVPSEVALEGLTRLSGEYDFVDFVFANQRFVLDLENVSGSFSGWGTLKGAGQVDYTNNSQEERADQVVDSNYLYCQNMDMQQVQISDINYGNVKIIPLGSVYISGTVGRVAESLSLHKFTGNLNLENNAIESVRFDCMDSAGVVLSNVETAEQSTTIFDSFTADVLSILPDGFDGRAGFSLVGGKVNIASDGPTYISLVTQDQDTNLTGSNVTGSLPEGVKFFTEAREDGSPDWEFTKVREKIVSKEEEGSFVEQDSLATGTAIVSGSFKDLTLQGTRKMLRIFDYIQLSGSRVPQVDIPQVSQMLSDIEAGISFANTSLFRTDPSSSVESSSVTPNLVSRALMSQRTFDTMMTASVYVVPGSDSPVWPSEYLVPRDLDFFSRNPQQRSQVSTFLTGSKIAATSLETFLSGSQLDIAYRQQSGQFTYVYLGSTGTDYLEANIKDFTGLYVSSGGQSGSLSSGVLSGSYQQLWGRFGEGYISQKTAVFTRGSREGFELPEEVVQERYPISFFSPRNIPGTSGVIYGAFDFQGYVDGGCEGNEVEGTVEGDISGVVSGLIRTGSITGGPVQFQGVSRGSFAGTVTGGQCRGAMKNLSIEGNNLTNNVTLEGSINGVEEFPLEGTLSGSIDTLIFPGKCSYVLTGSSLNPGQMKLNVPTQGIVSGEVSGLVGSFGTPEDISTSDSTEWYESLENLEAGIDIITPVEGVGYTIPSGSVLYIKARHNLNTYSIQVDPHMYYPITGVNNVDVRLSKVLSNTSVALEVSTYGLASGASKNIELNTHFVLKRISDWKRPVLFNLEGENISTFGTFAGTTSGSVSFGPLGRAYLPQRAESEQSIVSSSADDSRMSGQFEFTGDLKIDTIEGSPFSGKINPVTVDQDISGSFNVVIQTPTSVNLNMIGSLENFKGHALTRGLVDVKSGTQGNLVEGYDRPFFTLQNFSGSLFPEDTTVEAVRNMNISDMVVESFGFTSGMSLVSYTSGSFGELKEHEYVQNTLTLPRIGDIIYSSQDRKSRVVSSKIYCLDLNVLLTINDRGTVIFEDYLSQIQ